VSVVCVKRELKKFDIKLKIDAAIEEILEKSSVPIVGCWANAG
jgi:hypothetical protein